MKSRQEGKDRRQQSIKTVHAAREQGIRLFDTPSAYRTCHSERLLVQALKRKRDEAVTVTRFGYNLDEKNKVLSV